MKVEFRKDRRIGEIIYDEKSKEVVVDFEGDDGGLLKYFTTEREFRIPTSQTIDFDKYITAKPTVHKDAFLMALCEAYQQTGCLILFETLEGYKG